MHIGLIGGYGQAATARYYLSLTKAADAADLPFRLTLVHGDLKKALARMTLGQDTRQIEALVRHTETLRRAGAEICALTALGFHTYLDRMAELSDMPFCSLIDALRQHVREQGLQRIGIIGSHFAMSEALLGRDSETEILVPSDPEERDALNREYYDMAVSQRLESAQTELFTAAADKLSKRGAEAILLGGTDFTIARNAWDMPFSYIDPIETHVGALFQILAKAAAKTENPVAKK